MSLNNFSHDLSTALMPQTFEGFSDLCTKVHDIEIHLHKHKKGPKDISGEIGRLLTTLVAPGRESNSAWLTFSEETLSNKSLKSKKGSQAVALIAAQSRLRTYPG